MNEEATINYFFFYLCTSLMIHKSKKNNTENKNLEGDSNGMISNKFLWSKIILFVKFELSQLCLIF